MALTSDMMYTKVIYESISLGFGGRAMGSAVRIGLVTDQPIFCTGITAALGATENLSIVAHGQTAEDALRMATDATVDILLLEIAIPGVGTNAVKAICRARPGAKV